MRKKRILACSECSLSPTGYGVYYHELLTRLHATGKYDICELATYSKVGQDTKQIPWTFIPVQPADGDEQGRVQYESDPSNQWGQWKFEQTCIEFRPDIVFDIRDPWMFEHESRSPFRRFYHWAIMPPIDGLYQEDQWLAQYMTADAVFNYTEWGQEVLRKEGNGRIKLKGVASPAAETDIFRPHPDKAALKREVGIAEDSLIVGTVMRNQERKLYPDLIEAFAKYLSIAPPELGSRTFLYLHCRQPDIGWNITKLIKQAGISNKVIFTQICHDCGATYPTFFSGVKTFCRACGHREATIGEGTRGATRENLARIMNLFDVYVQYATHEGFGMPQVEAASCGVPVMAIDYSAMSDVVRKIGGTPIPPLTLRRDVYTHRLYAIPNNDLFAQMLLEQLSQPESYRAAQSVRTRELAAQFSYDTTAKVWEEHFDSVEIRPHAHTWFSSAYQYSPNFSIPEGLNNEQFVNWCLVNISGRPDLLDSYMTVRMLRDLNEGFCLPHIGGMPFHEFSLFGMQNRRERYNRDRAIREFINLGQDTTIWEQRRVQFNSRGVK